MMIYFRSLTCVFFPQVKGYSGYEDLEIQVSCVAAKSTSLYNGRASYKAHPFELHGEDCNNGICRKSVGKINKMAVLSNIRILRVKVNAMHESLMLRQSMNADPYRRKFPRFADSLVSRIQCGRVVDNIYLTCFTC